MHIALVTVLLFCALRVYPQAYGQWFFPHSGFNSAGAIRTTLNGPGFLRWGWRASVSPPAKNFYIEKADGDGMISGPGSFSNEYTMLQGDSLCASANILLSQCKGISVIETSLGTSPPARYAMGGAFSKGVFFSLLNAAGDEVMSRAYLFPFVPVYAGKPFICESAVTPSNYFITGAFDTSMYVLKVDASGTLLWSAFFHSYILAPQSIMECPWTGDLLVAGNTNVPLSYNKNTDGFILRLDPSNGNVISYKTYGNALCQGFYALSASSSSLGGNGFLVCGESDPKNTIGSDWILKIGVNGDVVWTRILEPSIAFAATPLKSIIERPLQPSGYEYYAATHHANTGVVVLRLTETGLPASGNNQFIYNAAAPNGSGLSALTCGSGSNSSIQVHGVDNSFNWSNYYFVSASLSGQSNCNQTLTAINAHEAGPDTVTSPWIVKYGGLSYCQAFAVKSSTVSMNAVDVCATAALRRLADRKEKPELSPQPVTGMARLNFGGELCGEFNMEIYDANGRCIHSLTKTAQGTSLNIDFAPLLCAEAVYFLRLRSGEAEEWIRFIFTK